MIAIYMKLCLNAEGNAARTNILTRGIHGNKGEALSIYCRLELQLVLVI